MVSNPDFSWLKLLIKGLVATLIPLIPSIVDWIVPQWKANQWGLPLVIIAVGLGALKALKNYYKNA